MVVFFDAISVTWRKWSSYVGDIYVINICPIEEYVVLYSIHA